MGTFESFESSTKYIQVTKNKQTNLSTIKNGLGKSLQLLRRRQLWRNRLQRSQSQSHHHRSRPRQSRQIRSPLQKIRQRRLRRIGQSRIRSFDERPSRDSF